MPCCNRSAKPIWSWRGFRYDTYTFPKTAGLEGRCWRHLRTTSSIPPARADAFKPSAFSAALPCIFRLLGQLLLDPQQLIVFRRAVGSAPASRF